MQQLRVHLFFIPLLALAPSSARGADDSSGKGALPPDLAAVPADALGFAHVRLADLWKNDALQDLREVVAKAGEQTVQAFDKRFLPAPSSLERLTVFVLPPSRPDTHEPMPVVIVTTNKPFDREAFLKQSIPGAEQRTANNVEFYVDERNDTGFRFLNDKTFAFGPAPAIDEWLKRNNPAQGTLRPAAELAASGKLAVVALNAEMLPAAVLEPVPPPLRPLLQAKLATLMLDLAGDARIDLRLVYKDAAHADAAEKALQVGKAMAKQALRQGRSELLKMAAGDGKPAPITDLPPAAVALVGIGALQQYEEILQSLPVQKQGDALEVTVRVPKGSAAVVGAGAVSLGLLLPAVQKVREAAARVQSANNLKQMGIAMYGFADSGGGRFPPAAICDKKGKPLLSWRVAILPYVDGEPLYKEFHLDEPWDSEHNKKLIERMPPVYRHPAAPPKPGITHYRCFVGNGAAFDWIQGARLPADFTDGLSNTWLVVEAAEGAPWTKPDELEYDPQKPLPKLGGFYSGGFMALLGDGAVRFFRSSIKQTTAHAYITRAGGEVIPGDE
jgi:Protein of unknown function (DUF1559)